MSTIVFLVDTSASMNQTTCSTSGRMSFLDIAKKAVELFIRERQKFFSNARDKYMLVTFDEPPSNVRATWKDSNQYFFNQLNLLEATSLTSLTASLKSVYSVLSAIRMYTGIDNFGRGRTPYTLQPATIILITDGGKITCEDGVEQTLAIPTSSDVPGFWFSKEIYYWDQRLFSVVLRFPGISTTVEEVNIPPTDAGNINALCELTGGRSFCIESHNMLLKCIHYLIFNIHQGFFARFKKLRTNILDSQKLVAVERVPEQRNRVGVWPIPESFTPSFDAIAIPPREAHPIIRFNRLEEEPEIMENFPVDEYIVDKCQFSKYMLTCAKPFAFWNIFIQDTRNMLGGLSLFGYLKADKNENTLKLFILTYHYPEFLSLVKTLLEIKDNITDEWREEFKEYLNIVPGYYIKPIRVCFRMLGFDDAIIDSIIPKNAHVFLNVTVKKLLNDERKRAKILFEKLHDHDEETCNDEPKNFITVSTKLDTDKLIPPYLNKAQFEFTEFRNFEIGLEPDRPERVQFNCDLPNTPRQQLLDHMHNIKYKFYNYKGIESIDEDVRHNIPISDMGQYGDLRKTTNLREINPKAERKNLFGNPFITTKEDERAILPQTPRRGALPRNLQYKKSTGVMSSPPLSPTRMASTSSFLNMPSTSAFCFSSSTSTETSSDFENPNEETIDVFRQSNNVKQIEVPVSPTSVLQNLKDSDDEEPLDLSINNSSEMDEEEDEDENKPLNLSSHRDD